MGELETVINNAFDALQVLSAAPSETLQKAVKTVIARLDKGELRAAEKKPEGTWVTQAWVKKAILLAFRLFPNKIFYTGSQNQGCAFYDKINLKYQDYTEDHFKKDGVRVVPGAWIREGAYVGSRTVLMPCFINTGAYIDTDCMIDTWATVGSCAQIGKNVHLSGGAGIGGVLEPLQANPTIIEDNCFIGARSEIVEGVLIETGAVIGMGVYIGQSTRIYNRLTGEVTYGKIPADAVVIPGNLPADDGSHSLYCAVIVKFADQKTRQKVGINALLRP